MLYCVIHFNILCHMSYHSITYYTIAYNGIMMIIMIICIIIIIITIPGRDERPLGVHEDCLLEGIGHRTWACQVRYLRRGAELQAELRLPAAGQAAELLSV